MMLQSFSGLSAGARPSAFLGARRICARGLTTKVQDPNQPKRPMSAYLLYQQKFRADNPGMGGKEVRSQTSSAWKSMAVSEREPFETSANNAFAQYVVFFATSQSPPSLGGPSDHYYFRSQVQSRQRPVQGVAGGRGLVEQGPREADPPPLGVPPVHARVPREGTQKLLALSCGLIVSTL